MVGDLLRLSRPLRPTCSRCAAARLEEAIASTMRPGEENPVEVDPRSSRACRRCPPIRACCARRWSFGDQLAAGDAARRDPDGDVPGCLRRRAQARSRTRHRGRPVPPEGARRCSSVLHHQPTGTGLGLRVVKRIAKPRRGARCSPTCDRGTDSNLLCRSPGSRARRRRWGGRALRLSRRHAFHGATLVRFLPR